MPWRARPLGAIAIAVLLLTAVTACGSSGTTATGGATTGAATSDAASAATGDIPDNQVFLTWVDRPAGYAIRYPEGWTRRGTGADVTFTDKDNAIHVVVAAGSPPTTASAQAALASARSSEPSLKLTRPPQVVTLAHGRVLKVGYSVLGSANAVTGKRPLLLVDRYLYAHGDKLATIDLATPKGVDNVDAYRMISRSFAWR